MEPITDHMRHVSLNHRGAEAAIAGVAAEARAATASTGASSAIPAGAPPLKASVARSSEVTGADDQRETSAARTGQGPSTDTVTTAAGGGGAAMDVDGKDGGSTQTAATGSTAAAAGAGGPTVDNASSNGTAGNAGNGGGRDRTDSSAAGSTRSGRRSRGNPDPAGTVSYNAEHIIGNGSFGVVFQAVVVETGEVVAIKKVLQDKRFKNRELQIMRMLVKKEHPNIVKLRHCFYSNGDKPDDLYLNLVLEFVPETVYSVARQYHKSKQTLPVVLVKLYLYQLARALAHIHALGICHRDIKPQNLLLDPQSHALKLCDFGSAKILVRGEPNVSYICSRYYRAPELIFGSTDYTCAIDTWSLGCVAAELLLGDPLFPGDSGVDQLVEIIKVLGTPTREEIRAMNSNYSEFKFPQIKAHPWKGVFRAKTPPEALDVVSKMLAYDPLKRIKPLEVCSHEFVNELAQPGIKLPNGNPFPPLFEYTELELLANPRLHAFASSARGAAAGSEGASAGGSDGGKGSAVSGGGKGEQVDVIRSNGPGGADMSGQEA